MSREHLQFFEKVNFDVPILFNLKIVPLFLVMDLPYPLVPKKFNTGPLKLHSAD
jgi:hypothetical protein